MRLFAVLVVLAVTAALSEDSGELDGLASVAAPKQGLSDSETEWEAPSDGLDRDTAAEELIVSNHDTAQEDSEGRHYPDVNISPSDVPDETATKDVGENEVLEVLAQVQQESEDIEDRIREQHHESVPGNEFEAVQPEPRSGEMVHTIPDSDPRLAGPCLSMT